MSPNNYLTTPLRSSSHPHTHPFFLPPTLSHIPPLPTLSPPPTFTHFSPPPSTPLYPSLLSIHTSTCHPLRPPLSVSVSPNPDSPWLAVSLQPGKIFQPKGNKLVCLYKWDSRELHHIFDAGNDTACCTDST